MIKGIDQQTFDKLYVVAMDNLQDVASVYDTLPNLSALYPFVVIGEIQVVPRQVKYRTLGKVYATVDVWGDVRHRRVVSDISEMLMEEFSRTLKLDTRRLKMVVSSSNKRVFEDTSVGIGKKALWRGILTLEFDILI